MSILLLILGLVLFLALVVVHEFGHFIAARRNGVEVEEFGIGFPPRARVLAKKKGTVFTLNWLPLGGFVKLKGEHDADREPGTYGAASLPNKIKIMLAGVGMNLVTAAGLFTILALVGMPKLIDNQFTVKSDTKVIKNEILVAYIEPGSPAEKAGLKLQDQLVSLTPLNAAAQQIDSENAFPALTKQLAGQTVGVQYKRGGKLQTVPVQLRTLGEVAMSKKTDQPKGYLGIAPTSYALQRSTWSAPIVAVGLSKQLTMLTFQGIWHALSSLSHGQGHEASSQVSGPVGVFVLLKDGSLLGYQFVIMIIAVISLTLAIMNVLPVPALDGGRLAVTLLFRGIKKPLKQKTEEFIHGTGFALLMMLFVLITVVDVRRFF